MASNERNASRIITGRKLSLRRTFLQPAEQATDQVPLPKRYIPDQGLAQIEPETPITKNRPLV